jgi:hypothetical protein
MPCRHIRSDDGKTTGFICSRASRRGRCQVCGGASEYECDYPASKASGTCDAKMCTRCSLHFAGRWQPLGEGLNLSDSYDFCPVHQPFVFYYGQRLIFVVNSRSVQQGELIDRTTPLGNPFKLGDEDTPAVRERILQDYRRHLWREMQTPESTTSRELSRLFDLWQAQGVLMLRCWCVPKACHGQVVARALVWQAEQACQIVHHPGNVIDSQ